MQRKVLTDGPEVSGDQGANVDILNIIAIGILQGISNRQPTIEEDELQNQKDGHMKSIDTWIIRLQLVTNHIKGKVGSDTKS